MKLLLVALLAAAAVAQPAADHTYVFRISHETYDDSSCALLHADGNFHLEFAHGDDVKVFEGVTTPDDVARLQGILGAPEIKDLSQRQIEEPLIRSRWETLQLTINRGQYSQDLFFQSRESEEPYRQSLEPLVHWLDNLRKRPHKQFTEDEGKQNCLPAREIVLKKRDPPPVTVESPAPASRITQVLKTPPLASLSPSRLGSIVPMLRVYSLSVDSSGARQFCALFVTDGTYRYEQRLQKNGKPVSTDVIGGKLDNSAVAELRTALDKPQLQKIQRREPRNSRVVPMLGNMMNLSIARPSGMQEIILSTNFGHAFGSLYGGDADLSAARDLTRFLREHVETNKAGTLDKSAQNDCTDAP